MKKYLFLFFILLIAGGWIGRGTLTVTSGIGAPVVSASTFTISSPVTNGGPVGTAICTANCSSVVWSITAGNSAGNFAINSSTGAITTTANGVTNIVDLQDLFSLTVQASNGNVGSNTVAVNAYLDGSVGAGGGTAQYPGLFTDSTGSSGGIPGGNANAPYGTIPVWKVAGVNYAVGIDRNVYPTDGNLKDPGVNGANIIATLGSGNVSYSSGVVSINSAITVDGYDFSLYGYGVSVTVAGATLTNDKIITNTSSYDPINSNHAVTIKNCWIDGGTTTGIGGHGVLNLGNITTGGTITVEYSWIRNGWAESFQIGNNDTTGVHGLTVLLRYNVIENAANGWGPTSGSVHGDWIQWAVNNSSAYSTSWPSIDVEYNTWLQWVSAGSAGSTGARTQGLTFAPAAGTIGTFQLSYNTGINTSGALVSFFSTARPADVSISQSFNYNYFDFTYSAGLLGSAVTWLNSFSDGNPCCNTSPTITGNLDMVNGSAMTLNRAPPYH